MKTIKILIICMFGMLLLNTTAAFAVIYETTQYLTWSGAASWDPIISRTVTQLNPNDGILNWVQLKYTGTTSGSLAVTNPSLSRDRSFSATLASNTYLYLTSDPANVLADLNPTINIGTNIIQTRNTTTTYGAGLSATESYTNMLNNSNSDLSLWTGPGTVSLTAEADNTSYFAGTGLTFDRSVTTNGYLEVTYNYLKVSDNEPSTLVIFGLGLIGTVFFGRRFRNYLVA